MNNPNPNPGYVHTRYSCKEEEIANRKRDAEAFDNICKGKFNLRKKCNE